MNPIDQYLKTLIVKLLDDEDGINTDAYTALEELVHYTYKYTPVPQDINDLLRSVKSMNGRCYIEGLNHEQ